RLDQLLYLLLSTHFYEEPFFGGSSTDFVVVNLWLYTFRTPGGTGSVQAVYRQCTITIEPVFIEKASKTHLFHNNFSLGIRVQNYT
ncbi:MAG: hypothetical protein MJZ62_05210, partial [Bacteroidales bacterium]|nr:hypothetical protein [Bacteroidales bacterium]